MGAMYAAVIFLGVNNASTVQPVVAVERTVFYRERAAGMYAPLPYAIAQGAVELPYIFAQTVVYSLITYAMVQFEWTAAKFFWYFLFMYLTFCYFTFYGMMMVGLTPNLNLASVVSTFFYSIWNLFSGFIVPRPKMPPWWQWFSYICPIAWTLEGLIASQFGNLTNSFTAADGTEYASVKSFLDDYFDFKESMLGVCVAVLLGFSLVFWLMFALSIKFFNFQRR
eukprot:TRINITY_DN71_c0_g6_i2.p1 TRINITY_DN71_c0_g6~~TRINITY_DN71_c0_g6_i2.p1  ORF type:complete len:224 (-),score=40.54 TRINITY_DN71_c0_g6_i2:845-1516(-)